jgi:hypothetical protein
MRCRSIAWLVVAAIAIAAIGVGPARAGLVPEFGVKGGLNFSNINVDDLDSSNRTGWVGGVYLDLATPLLHLQPEALVTSKGFKGGEVGTGNHELEYRAMSLEVPVLIVLSLPIPAISPRAYVGPALSFPLKSEVRMTDGGPTGLNSTAWQDIKDDTKNTWSVVMGAGVKLGPLGVELRYDIGMSAFNDRPVSDIVDDLYDEFTPDNSVKDIKDRTFSVLASFGFN